MRLFKLIFSGAARPAFGVRAAILFFLASAALCPGLSAAKIEKIIFNQQSDYKFPDKMLQFNIQMKPGSEFDDKTLNQDIKRLFATGFFSDVAAETTTTPSGNVIVELKVTPKPKIKEIVFEGNKVFPTGELAREISLNADMPLNDVNLKDSAAKLRKFYSSKGYNDAVIQPKVVDAGGGMVNVVFKIDEKLKQKINDVTFVGNTVFSNWKLKHSISNQYSYFSWILDTGLLNREELQNDKLRLRDMYWNLGYLDFKVDDIEITEDPGNPEYVNLTFKIHEGEPYKVGKITISGNTEYSEEELLPLLSLKTGDVFDNRKEKEDIDIISDRYASLGYADFRCRAVRYPDYKNKTVDLEYVLNEGIIYYVRDVYITGNEIVKDYVIRRELAIQPGDPVDKNRIETSKSRLMGMGYFEDVEPSTAGAGEAGKKDVNFKVKEKNTAGFRIGGGYSDTDSLAGMLELSESDLDITDPSSFFRGGGQRLRAQALVGLTRYDFNVNFTEPWMFGLPWKFDLGGYFNNVTYEHWQEQRAGFKTSLSHKLFDDFTSAGLGYRFENVRVHKMDDWMSPYLLDQEGSKWVSAVSMNLNRDTRDSMLDPTSGYQINFLEEVTTKILGASENYYRTEMKASNYYSFFDKFLIWHLGGKVGTVSSFNRENEVPLFEKYFLGGGDSIRGFPYRNISPVDDNDINCGGQSMMMMTTEVTHPIWEFIRGAVFLDAGNVYKNSFSYNFNQINAGTGYGLRIKVPYVNAPVKVDLAYPILNKQQGYDSKFRVHFDMGFAW
jgi:outer membrane protein insertion porin family